MDRDVQAWRQNKPLRFGRNLDADVQQFLAQGVRIMDDFNEEMPLGLSDSHRQVRNRCNELARGMEKVLAKRPDEERPGDPWKYVKIRVTPPSSKSRGRPPGPWRRPWKRSGTACAAIFRAAHGRLQKRSRLMPAGRENAEAVQADMYPPMPEAARSWNFFMRRADHERLRVSAERRALGAGRSERRHRFHASHELAAVVRRAAETPQNKDVRPWQKV